MSARVTRVRMAPPVMTVSMATAVTVSLVMREYTAKQVCEHYVLMVMWEYTVKQVCEHYAHKICMYIRKFAGKIQAMYTQQVLSFRKYLG